MMFLFSILLSFSEVKFNEVREIINKRCIQCHNENWPDRNWKDNSKVLQFKQLIALRVSVRKDMPPANITEITEEEREIINKWANNLDNRAKVIKNPPKYVQFP